MPIVRNIILLGAVVALMPTDQAQQARFYEQAAGAVRWTVTFCDRNAAMCTEGQALWATFVKKAEFGAGVAYDLIQRQISGSAEAPVHPASDADSAPRGTLRPADLEPVWRGPAPRGGTTRDGSGRTQERRGA